MLSRATSLIAAVTITATAAAAGTFMTTGKGHCEHQGLGVGHFHHDDDCSADSPTPTPGSTDTPVATVTATVVVTVTVTPTATPATVTAGLLWKDATGTVVPRIHVLTLRPIGIGGPTILTYTDGRGLFWSINQWTLALTIPVVGQSPSVTRMFETSNCTGSWFIRPEYGFPRMPFIVDNDPTIRVVPDAPTLATHSLHSYDGGPGTPCNTSWSNTLVVLPGDETVPAEPITIPTLPFVAPMHPEAN